MSPIRASERARYPKAWPTISRIVRFWRAQSRCECDGRCGSRHHTSGLRCEARHGEPHPSTGSKVVLTVAHLDHTPEHCHHSNLLAMCQACHLSYDAAHHAETRRNVPGQLTIGDLT